MEPWLVLGIEETDDKAAVKRAYLAQLGKHNPEDDPEGFQRVREAYERIIARIDEEKTDDDTPLGRFMNKVELLYGDFSKRVSVECWKELLKEDICTQLATEDAAGRGILEFLTDNWYVPGAVLETLDDHFHWLGVKDELQAFIPASFLDYIENQIQHEYPIYAFFDKNKNPDRFIYLLYEADRLLNANDLDDIDDLIAEMEETGIAHPCLLQAKTRLALARGDTERAMEYACSVFSQYPDDFNSRYAYALVMQTIGNAEVALPILLDLLDERPLTLSVENGVIECLVIQEKYEEARIRLLKVLEKYPSNALAIGGFQYVSELLIGKYEKLHRENPKDIEIAFMLAKNYLNRARHDECFDLLKKLKNSKSHPRYNEFMGECLLRMGRNDSAIEYFLKDISSNKRYRNYVYLVTALIESERWDEALRYADEGLLVDDDDATSTANIHYLRGLIHREKKQYEQALASFNTGIAANEHTQQLYTGKANTYKDMGRYAEAIDCCFEAIEILPLNPEPYAVGMDIYLITDQYQKILDLAKSAEKYNILDYPRVMYYIACALAGLSRWEEARDILMALILDEEMEDKEYRPRIYCELSYVSDNQGNRKESVSYLERAIALDRKAKWPIWRLQLGRLYKACGNIEMAIETFNLMIEAGLCGTEPYLERGTIFLEQDMTIMARRDFEKAVKMEGSGEADYDRIIQIYSDCNKPVDALKWADLELKLYDSAENRMQKAWVLVNMHCKEEAIRLLEKAKITFPGNDKLHRRLAHYYMATGRDYQKALDEFTVVLEINPGWPNIYEDVGECLSLMGRYDDAISLLSGAIEKAPDKLSLYARRGRLYMDTNRQNEARSDLLHAITDPEALNEYWHVHFIYYWLGFIHEMYMNDAESALEYYELSVELKSEFSSALASIGDIYFFRNNIEEALEWYDRAVLNDSANAKYFLKRAVAYSESGQKAYAKSEYKAALRFYSKKNEDACYHAHMGECYLGLGQYKKALMHFGIAIDKAASCGQCQVKICHEAYFGLCKYYTIAGQPEKALEFLETAINAANTVQYNLYKTKLTEGDQK